jgi:hypothetical protein
MRWPVVRRLLEELPMVALTAAVGVLALFMVWASRSSETEVSAMAALPAAAGPACPSTLPTLEPSRTIYVVGSQAEEALLLDSPHFTSGPGQVPAMVVVVPSGAIPPELIFECTRGSRCLVPATEIVDLRLF